jgi:hypothetical protein
MKNFNEIKKYLLENTNTLQEIVGQINSWEGSLENLEFYENDENFFELCFEGKPMEAVRAAQFGDYRYTDAFVKFNGYGNLDSYTEHEVEEELKSSIDEILERMEALEGKIDIYDEELVEIMEHEDEPNTYYELKQKQQDEFNNFPLFFAFSDEQFKAGMEKLGLNHDETNKIYSIGGGGYYRRDDSAKFKEMIDRFEAEKAEARKDEKYLLHMFSYELANHEYGYTYDIDDTLDALDLTIEEVKADAKLLKALQTALQKYE